MLLWAVKSDAEITQLLMDHQNSDPVHPITVNIILCWLRRSVFASYSGNARPQESACFWWVVHPLQGVLGPRPLQG